MSVIPCHRGGHNCNWPACPQDCDGRPAADAYSAALDKLDDRQCADCGYPQGVGLARTREPHLKALAWRERLGLTRNELARLSGVSVSQIRDYEGGTRRGKAGTKACIRDAAWKRYALVCAAVEAGLKAAF